jgi:hypothetical protein
MTEQTKEAKNTWVVEEGGRRRFWATAKELGLDKDATHKLFNVESMYDYAGTLAEAIAIMKMSGPSQESPAPPPPAEAEAVLVAEAQAIALQADMHNTFSVKAYDPDGFDIMLVIRDTNSQELIKRGRGALAYLKTHGFTPMPPHRASQPQGGQQQAQPKQPPPPSGVVPPTAAQAGVPNFPASNGSIEETESIKITAPKGKPVVEFWRPGRQYPEVTWNLGGARLLELAPWMAKNGWTVEHFDTIGASYDLRLSISWVPSPKNPKWKDITAIELRS